MKWSTSTATSGRSRARPREKGNPGALKLPPLAMKMLARLPRMAGNPYVFPAAATVRWPVSRTATPPSRRVAASTVGHCTIAEASARSLMSRTSVRPDIAERVLGHAVGGSVAGVYDRHHYRDEMADALKRLARLIEKIVSSEGDNVVPFIAQ